MWTKWMILLAGCLYFTPVTARPDLTEKLLRIIGDHRALVGVAVACGDGEPVTVGDHRRYAMLSTMKFPLAVAVLAELERQGAPLDTGLLVTKADLKENTYSPLRDARPGGDFMLSAGELLRYSVSLSDNNACDRLIRFLGGTEPLQRYLQDIGITDMEISLTEEEMHRETAAVYRNATRPSAAVRLLEKFLRKELLGEPYQAFLEKILTETVTGPDKLKGRLPAGTVVGHKTGSSDRSAAGMKFADNDMGYIMLPDGRYVAIAVFVMDSLEDDHTNASLIARIAEAVYAYYTAGAGATHGLHSNQNEI